MKTRYLSELARFHFHISEWKSAISSHPLPRYCCTHSPSKNRVWNRNKRDNAKRTKGYCVENKRVLYLLFKNNGGTVVVCVCGGEERLWAALGSDKKMWDARKMHLRKPKIGQKTRLDRHCVDIARLFSDGSAPAATQFFLTFFRMKKRHLLS